MKKAPQIIKDITKEKLEKIELKPTKIEKKEIHKSDFETIQLKSVPKDVTNITITEKRVTRDDDTTIKVHKEETDATLLKTSHRLEEIVSKMKKAK